MIKKSKPIIAYEDFEKIDMRLGKVISIEIAPNTPKKSYKITADFGKYGVKTSVGRLTQHKPEELIGKQIMGVINFEPRQVGDTLSEFLTLGVQYPKADSGEATIITPLVEAKLGSKLF